MFPARLPSWSTGSHRAGDRPEDHPCRRGHHPRRADWAAAHSGIALGIGLGYAAARSISSRLQAASGIEMPVGFAAGDLGLFLGLFAAASICALVPALVAYP